MNHLEKLLVRFFRRLNNKLNLLGHLISLGIRVFIAHFFFVSGMTKIQNWSQTLFLFEHEYHVPLISSQVAAFLGTGAELVLPVFLVLGLGGRYVAITLSIFNVVAVYSYPFLWTKAGYNGLMQHVYYGFLLFVPIGYGCGWISVDRSIKGWADRRYPRKKRTHNL